MDRKIDTVFPKEKNVPIVFSANNSYIPVLSVMIQSVIENSSSDHTYDIFILNRDIDSSNEQRLQSMVAGYSNFSLRLIDVSDIFADYNLYTANRREFTVESYFRLAIPDLLSNYEKVVYLDGDMALNADIAELFEVNLGDNLLASSIDCPGLAVYHGLLYGRKDYRDNVLKLKNPDTYFCAGMLVLNVAQFRKEFTCKQLLEFAASYNWEQHDQDVLNVLCQGRTVLVHPAWDYIPAPEYVKNMPKNIRKLYLESKEAPKIVHWAALWRKPYRDLNVEYGDLFWRYAGKTPFYREILSMVRDANRHAAVVSEKYKELLVEQFAKGQIGFKYIIKYIKAWLRYKLTRQ